MKKLKVVVDHLKGRTTISEMSNIPNPYFHYFYKENFEKNVKRDMENDKNKEEQNSNNNEISNISSDDIVEALEELGN